VRPADAERLLSREETRRRPEGIAGHDQRQEMPTPQIVRGLAGELGIDEGYLEKLAEQMQDALRSPRNKIPLVTRAMDLCPSLPRRASCVVRRRARCAVVCFRGGRQKFCAHFHIDIAATALIATASARHIGQQPKLFDCVPANL
jgi:hypothetical protein